MSNETKEWIVRVLTLISVIVTGVVTILNHGRISDVKTVQENHGAQLQALTAKP